MHILCIMCTLFTRVDWIILRGYLHLNSAQCFILSQGGLKRLVKNKTWRKTRALLKFWKIWLVFLFLYCCTFVLIFKGFQMDNKNTMKNRKNARESKAMQMSVFLRIQRDLQIFNCECGLLFFTIEFKQAIFIFIKEK